VTFNLFRGRIKVTSTIVLHLTLISRKPLEIEGWFQKTTNRKWHVHGLSNGHVTDDVT